MSHVEPKTVHIFLSLIIRITYDKFTQCSQAILVGYCLRGTRKGGSIPNMKQDRLFLGKGIEKGNGFLNG